MAALTLPFTFTSFLCFIISFNHVQGQERIPTDRWCVAQFNAREDVLVAFIEEKCTFLYCKPIMPGGSCYQPTTLINHASYVIDVNYKATGECDLNIAQFALTDPSFGRCRYP
ncbi:glucan endo-1,3-beta-glucosidase-like [Rutidosis leptorrhynchoides]|uniref:glucan endo-1,3-beta-glucosidase-like n=1 Tax=Rutidosis leptorrhynchoides TaxID=125765 RepID=UPI003A996C6D